MNIVRKDIDQSNVTLTLRIEKADYTEKVEKTLRDYRKKANIPGFRPGMVPVGLVKKMYGKAVLAEEINKIVSDELYKYIRENNVNMLGEPMPNETEQQEINFDTQEDFEFVFDLGLAPEFEVELSKKDKVKYYNIAVSDVAKTITSDFQFKIEGITRYHESAIDQELFDKVYGEGVVNSEEEFRAKIKESIQESLTGDSEYKFGVDAREVLLAKFDNLVFPDAFLKRWVLATNQNLTVETLEADYDKMIADLKWQLIKDKLAKSGEIKVETEDVNEYAKKVTRAQFAQYGMVGMDDELISNYAKDMLKKEETLKNIIEKVAENKVFDIVKNAVKLDTKEVSIEEFNKMFEN
mgnify:CR=1 FL=1